MEASAHIKVFCRNIWLAGKVGSLVNKTVIERVGDFEGRLGETSVYPKFDDL